MFKDTTPNIMFIMASFFLHTLIVNIYIHVPAHSIYQYIFLIASLQFKMSLVQWRHFISKQCLNSV